MIRIDRLVLDLPGVGPARAEHLGRSIGEAVAESGNVEDSGRIEVLLPPGAASDDDILAALESALRARVA